MKKNINYIYEMYKYSIFILITIIILLLMFCFWGDSYKFVEDIFKSFLSVDNLKEYKWWEKLKDLYLWIFNVYLAFLGLYVWLLWIFFSMKQIIVKLVDDDKSLVQKIVNKIHILFYFNVFIIVILLFITLYIILLYSWWISKTFFWLIMFFIFCIIFFLENIRYMYWIFSILINRYIENSNSWKWSYWENAIFKANFINNFIKENNIKTVTEFWCGDWNNLELYKIENYEGLDVSEKAINICKEKFKEDKTKQFSILTDWEYKAELTLSLDVTYHIFPKIEWKKYINKVINSATKFAIFYNFPKWTANAPHINDYNFEEYLKELSEKKNFTYIKSDLVPPESNSRFYIITK